jgi:tetratricopeptide (TPR) repeat protein
LKLSLSELNYNLGHVLHRQGDLPGAVQAYEQAIQIDPAFIAAYHCLAVVWSEQGRYEEAVWQYRWIIQQQPNAVKAYSNLGQILIQQAQYSAAIDCFEELLKLDSSAHTGCGLAYLGLGQFDQALIHFQQALLPQAEQIAAFCKWVEQLPHQACDHDELTLTRQACGRFLSLLYRKTNISSNTSRDINTNINSDINWLDSIKQQLGQTCWHLGNLLMQYGGKPQLRQAETYYQQALRLQPHSLAIYLKLAECLVRQQRLNAAVMLYRLALTVHLDSAQLYQGLGCVLEQQQHWTEAMVCYRQAFTLTKLSSRLVESSFKSSSGSLAQLQQQSRHVDASSDRSSANLIQYFTSTLDWVAQHNCRYITFDIAANQLSVSETASRTVSRTDIVLRVPQTLTDANPCAPVIGTTVGNGAETDCKQACAGLNCQPCLQKIIAQFAPVHLGKQVYACEATELQVQPHSCFVAQIPEGIAWMTPYQTPWMVTNSLAVLTADGGLLTDVSREYPGQLPTCAQMQDSKIQASKIQASQAQDSQRVFALNQADVVKIDGKVAVVAGLSGHNYFHWMVDVLPRLELLRQSRMIDQIDWFWINRPQSDFQQETLRWLGIPATKLLAADQHPCIQADLTVPAFPSHLGWVEPWVLAFLRRQFLPKAAQTKTAQSPSPERIYISRAQAHHRRLLNETAVVERLARLGFVSVELEALPLTEQIALFAQAKVIVAPHGGGLTNLLFCQPGTAVIELFAPSYIRPYYWPISHHLKLRHYFITGESPACPPIHHLMYPSPLMADIWIDLDSLNIALRQVGLLI